MVGRESAGPILNGLPSRLPDIDPDETAEWIASLDEAMRDRIAALNPRAAAKVANRLIEASERNYWSPDAATLAALHAATDAIEDALEGVSNGTQQAA